MARYLVPLFALVLGTAATASDMRGMLLVTTVRLCMYQDAAYRASLWGRFFETHPRFEGWAPIDALPLVQCLRQRQWASASLCASAVELDPDDRPKLAQWFGTHGKELAALEPVTQLMFADEEGFTCPTLTLER